jgi:hypothetical protein
MLSRAARGYDADLAHLGRLRSACLGDKRLTTTQFIRIVESIQIIEKTLRGLPKARKRAA